MADEFIKGFGILSGAGLGWMILAGWYNTPGFEEDQLVMPPPETIDVYGELALVVKEALFWFAILGALVFWVLIPGLRQVREATDGDAE